jgi:hypothetical protein
LCLDRCRSDEAILGESAVAARLQELGGARVLLLPFAAELD